MIKNFSIVNETKSVIPLIPFLKIKETALGKKYDLTLIITSSDKIKKLNAIYRDKEYPTDILSFPLSKSEGEIYICPTEAKKEMVKFERNFENFFAFLFIHGCVHLKGHDHGSTMESVETKLRKKFNV